VPERPPPAHAGHGWLAAIVPADAARFRVADPALAETLRFAGAELVEESADVEIGSACGDAACSILVVSGIRPEGGQRFVRAALRAARSLRTRLRAAVARARLEARGYPRVTKLLWALDRPLPLPGLRPAEPPTLPVWALVVGRRRTGPTVLEAAAELAGIELEQRPTVRQGVVVAFTEKAVLRVALGPAERQIEEQRAVLERLGGTMLAPRLLGDGHAGLARWTLEERLPGTRPAALTNSLRAQSVDYLVDLFRLGSDGEWDVRERAALVAAASGHAAELDSIGERLADSLASVPRGFAHGDFWSENLLVDGDRLAGVVDWDYGGGGRPPALDLLHLLVNEERRRRRLGIGRAMVDYLFPGDPEADVRDYFARLDVDPALLPDLSVAYWLDYVARQLELYADRAARPVWMHDNVTAVLNAAGRARPRSAG
jgi:hypothetical protein